MEVLSALPDLTNLSLPTIALVTAIFARISALVMLLPGLGESSIPVRPRLAVAMAVALILTPMVISTAAPPQTLSGAAMMIVAEVVFGALIGFSIRIAIFTLQTAGSIASQSLSLAQLFGSNIDAQLSLADQHLIDVCRDCSRRFNRTALRNCTCSDYLF